MIAARTISTLLVLTLLTATGVAAAQVQIIVTFNTPPVYLPRTSFWKHALPPVEASFGNEDLDTAYRKYLSDDQLGSRAHLYRALLELAKPEQQGVALRAVSLQCLLDMRTIPDSSLLVRDQSVSLDAQELRVFLGKPARENSVPWEKQLLSAKWKKQAGDTTHPAFLPWIELFDAYQRYRHGNRQDASAAWKRLAESPDSGPTLSGLAWLGVAQVAGENLLEARGPTGPSRASAQEALDAVTKAVDAFTSAKSDLGTGQAHILAAEIDYVLGQQDAAFKELEAANNLFQKADDVGGWSDVNLIGGLGLNRAGKTEDAENAVLAAEESLGKLRVPPEQIEGLARFAGRIPGLTGEPDSRSIELKLADAHEFNRWTAGTDPMVQLISLRNLAQVLREGGYLGDADFYEALWADLSARYRAVVPLAVRIERAALADYDYLRQTKELERSGPAITRSGFSKLVEVHLAAMQGLRDEALKDIPGINLAEAQEAFALYSKELKKRAAKFDDAGRNFHERMAAGDRDAAAQALADTFKAVEVILDFLNTFNPETKLGTITENANIDAMEQGKRNYEIHAKIAFEYRLEVPKMSELEMQHAETHLNLIRDVSAAAILGDERYLRRGVRTMVEFYDEYRNAISAPDLLDLPFTFQTSGGNVLETSLPTETKKRDELIDKAVTELGKQYREKLIQDTISVDPKAPAVVAHDSTTLFTRDNSALVFFQRNWEENAVQSKVESNEVTRTEQNGKMVVNIEHAHTSVFDLKKESDYSKLPPASLGIDLQKRAQAVRAGREGLRLPIDTVRFGNVLESLSSERAGGQMLAAYLGTTPEQLAQQGAVFSSLMDAGQLALSAQKAGDFLPLPGARSFDYWKKLLQSDTTARTWASLFAQISEPNLAKGKNDEEQAANIGRSLMARLSKSEMTEEDPAKTGDQNPAHSVIHLAAIAQTLGYRPFLLLLLGDRPAADLAARKIADKLAVAQKAAPASMDHQAVEDSLGLALYSMATGAYDRAIAGLKPLPGPIRRESAPRVFQIEYLLAMCYRRIGDQASEAAALLAAADDLDKLRTTLRTRNQAVAVQALRQIIYEEYLGSLFEQKRYPQMAEALRHYKRSNQLPISTLSAEGADPRLSQLVGETALLYDVLSREDVWKVSDSLSLAALMEILNAKTENPADTRQSSLLGLNHIADVLVDEMQPAALRRANSNVAALTPPSSNDELAIFFFVGSRGLYRVIISPTHQARARYVPIPESELSELCGRFRSAIEERKDFAAASVHLYEILLGEVPELKTTQHVSLSPDGALNFIPFQGLKSRVDGPYLIEDHILSYLSETPAPAASAANAVNNRILVVGNPDGTLPAAETEATRIAQLPGMEAGDPLLRGKATLENLSNRLPGAGFVHFATHAMANPSAPNFAYLQLANGERLYSLNLGGLRFSGKHVFLSACETRMGQSIPGEDIYGIADSFLAGGAASVVSTLWRIESESSALFAQRYYDLLVQTRNAATALAMTEREFIHGKWYVERGGTPTTLDAPLYWAGFNYLGSGLAAR